MEAIAIESRWPCTYKNALNSLFVASCRASAAEKGEVQPVQGTPIGGIHSERPRSDSFFFNYPNSKRNLMAMASNLIA